MKYIRDSEKLHEIVRDNAGKAEKHKLTLVVSQYHFLS